MFSSALSWWPPGEWPENSPETLLHLSLQTLVSNPEVFLDYDEEKELYRLRKGLTLPGQICEQLIQLWLESDTEIVDDKFLHIFKNTQRTKLKRLNLADSVVSDRSLQWVMRHKPRELNIDNCHNLSADALNIIQEYSENLVVLFIGEQSQLFPAPMAQGEEFASDAVVELMFDCPSLQALCIHNLGVIGLVDLDLCVVFQSLTRTLQNMAPKLVYLDLSRCEISYEPLIRSFGELKNLTTLILYDLNIVGCDPAVLFRQIKKLNKLRALDLSQGKDSPVMYDSPEDTLRSLVSHLPQLTVALDLSQGKDSPVMYDSPEDTLRSLVSHLPQLTHLDLSGTNLPGFIRPQEPGHRHRVNVGGQNEDHSQCAIPGLEGRYLEFLGLLNCPYEANRRDNIPAKHVAGDADEHQIVLSVQKYQAKSDLLLKGLNSLFQLCRYSECRNQCVALKAILEAMRKHPLEKTIQISGSASLFYICKSDDKHNLSTKVKRYIIRTLLDGMENHAEETTMLRNGCLTLCHFKIPQDVLFDYERVVRILLDIVRPAGQEEFVQHVGIYLLNSLACQVDGREKQLVGDLGAIQTMLGIIEVRLSRGVCDEVMEIAWSTMWNVTDETAVNCERFIEGDGMELFLKCLQKFPDKEELLRNMMGLLGNVAEVTYLRPRLMQSEYVQIFSDLLDSASDGIEVSYNACGVLAHMVSDGPRAWTADTPTRIHVLQRMVSAIARWKINTKRNINYRSFDPILRLLPKFETPEAQHWATWALCNLTKVYRKKYCDLVVKEHGVPLLEELTFDPRPFTETKTLAHYVIQRCKQYKDSEGDTTDDDDDMDFDDDNQ